MKKLYGLLAVLLIAGTVLAQPGNVICPDGMTHYWKLDEEAGPPFIDFWGTADAQAVNAPVMTAGIVNNAQLFDGVNDEVTVPADGTYDWGVNQSFSIEYWMKPNTDASGNRVAVGRDDASTQLHFWSGIWASGNASFILIDKQGTLGLLEGTTNMKDGNWHLIAAVRDAGTNMIHLYVDGTEEAAEQVNYVDGFDSPTSELNIGFLNLTNHFRFPGAIDELALYDVALTPELIQQHYASGLEGKGYCSEQAQNFVLLAGKEIRLYRQAHSEGDIHSNGKIEYKSNRYWRRGYHTGNISAVGDIKVHRGNTVDGDATAGGKIDVQPSSEITGSITPYTVVENVPLPDPSFEAGGPNVVVNYNQTLELDPGSYKDCKVKWFGKLKLTAGDYYFKKFEVHFFGKIIADITGGPVNVYIVKKMKLQHRTRVKILPDDEFNTDKLSFTVLDHGSVKIGSFSKFMGNLTAPKAKVYVGNYSRVKGAITAEKISIGWGSQFLPHSSEMPLAKISDSESNEEQGSFVELTDYSLEQNYPNPFNPTTTINFTLPQPSHVNLTVYNLLGEKVAVLVNEIRAEGIYNVNFNASNLPTGVYIYTLQTENFTSSKKMQLIK